MNSRRNISVAHPVLSGNEKAYVNDCLDTSWISSVGKYISKFEQSFGDYCGASHAVACCNGTVALHLALLGLGVGPGDEVIVPTLTFISTANAVRYCGAEPVFIDSEPVTMNLDADLLETCITPKTKGIIAVHLYGHPCDMDAVQAVARRHGLFVIEDAAEAHGAEYKGRRAGSLADAATFSFYGNKIITTGEGGMITTNSESLEQKMRILRGQGMDPNRRYWFPIVGYNYRMTNIAAAIGLAQLEQIEVHLAKRQEVAQWYSSLLAPHVDSVRIPTEQPWAHHAFWSYSIVLKESSRMNRDAVMTALAEDGVETRPIFYPLHSLPPYVREGQSLPVAEEIAANGISLPMHGLLTREDVEYVTARLMTHVCPAVPV